MLTNNIENLGKAQSVACTHLNLFDENQMQDDTSSIMQVDRIKFDDMDENKPHIINSQEKMFKDKHIELQVT